MPDPTQQRRELAPPPSPPPNVDPQPGPFIIFVDENGEIADKQRGVVANAVSQWSGEQLETFSICFNAAGRPTDWDVVHKAIDWVAKELKAHDARAVVTPAGWRCAQASPQSLGPRSHVMIMGVIRL